VNPLVSLLSTGIILYTHHCLGSMDTACLSSHEDLPQLLGKGAPRPCVITPLTGSSPHTVFYDVTHDNETPLSKRTAEDALSTGALVTFTRAALGSNKGFDDLYPKLLNLVTDSRIYDVHPDGESGIGRVKRVLNHLHTEMLEGGFVEGHVHEEGEVSRLRAAVQAADQVLVHNASSSTPCHSQGIHVDCPHCFQGLFRAGME
jgi:hypothetical protein